MTSVQVRRKAVADGRCGSCRSHAPERRPRAGRTSCDHCLSRQRARDEAKRAAAGKAPPIPVDTSKPHASAGDIAEALGKRRLRLLVDVTEWRGTWVPRDGHWRRGDCAREVACMDDWIDQPALRTRQARCPRACPGFAPRVARVEVAIGGTLGAAIGGLVH